jgi:hypothetical protein
MAKVTKPRERKRMIQGGRRAPYARGIYAYARAAFSEAVDILSIEGLGMSLQFIGKLVRVATLAVALPACVPPEPQYINNPAFAQQAPPAGRPTYIETIRYIDDGLRYVDPTAAFFVSPDGRMCFRGVLTALQTDLDNSYISYWCLLPTAVNQVYTIGMGQVGLSCKHADPQCIHEIGYLNRATNTAHIRIVPSDQEKTAVEHLIYLMGGTLGDGQPFKWSRSRATSGS